MALRTSLAAGVPLSEGSEILERQSKEAVLRWAEPR